jgi:Rod binding domain-containing protein
MDPLAFSARLPGGKSPVPLGAAPQGKTGAEAKARKTAQEFETMFLEQTLDRMFATVGGDGPLGENGTGGEVYRSMLVKEYAGSIARNGGVGIANHVYREILKLQEGGHAKHG